MRSPDRLLLRESILWLLCLVLLSGHVFAQESTEEPLDDLAELSPFAKILLLQPLLSGGDWQGRGGLVFDPENQTYSVCSVGHVLFPQRVIRRSDPLVLAHIQNLEIPLSFFLHTHRTYAPAEEFLPEGNNWSSALCVPVELNFQHLLGEDRLEAQAIPLLQERKIMKGDQLYLMGNDFSFYSFTVVHVDRDALEVQLAIPPDFNMDLFIPGDSGTPAYFFTGEEYVQVGSLNGRVILPTREGPLTRYLISTF